ncbi:hypothetical protein Cgig2_031012 [Carnegiea gigantea]|uniref:AMP-dependent synthetase/ligase domain-containing protein n=1 Tax=Carnegiea gigantea TaxID=171969 RepID=A0A9Q1QJ61_9CARY|nr:hypothetical protein Cgig2_031012 [Carnegiea gigantea]
MDHLKPSPANSSPLTPLSFLERAAVVYGDCPSIVYDATTYTWAQTYHRCLQIASSISSLGLGRGHVVSVVAPNVPAAYELHFAVPMSGAILNNINTRLDSRTVSLLLQHSESKLVFVYHQLLPLVLQAFSLFSSSHPRPILVVISDNENNNCTVDPSQTTTSINPSIEYMYVDGNNQIQTPNHRTHEKPIEVLTTYEEMVRKGDPRFKWIQPESDWSPIVLNYTSGTTSSPKGVAHCHRGSFIMSMDSLIDWGVPKQPVFLWTLPMFHSNGWTFTWGMAAVGGTNVCLRRFDGATIHAAIRHHHVTHMCAAPVVLNMLISLNPSPDPLPRPAAVVARPDEYWGETPCAFVSLKHGVVDRDHMDREIIKHCRERMPHYMVPRMVVFKELPKTSTGKIQKFVLREMAKSLEFDTSAASASLASRL